VGPEPALTVEAAAGKQLVRREEVMGQWYAAVVVGR
jgi:hypothetical protein